MTPPLDPSADTGNHLRYETSLYLRQHADNPVDWYPWNDDALLKAKREDKPIFLSIGYSSCHWCHVMEREVFENDEIADYLNDHYVSIKVDREERPDIDRIYMEAVQILTRRGGWPMSVWLTPDLKPFFGGSYFPPDIFFDIIQKLSTAWDQNRGQLEDTAEQLHSYISRNPIGVSPESLTREHIKTAGMAALQQVDRMHGGFQAQMKFPTPLRWQFLLHLYRREGDLQIAKAVRHALVAMASGGLQDHIGGGFHRYTTDQRWTIPHFEKMLYDNAQLASLYFEAAAVFDDKMMYGRVGERTLDFLLRKMYDDEQGGFYSSIDADSDGVEGSYYVWTPEEIEKIAGKDANALMMLLGVTPEGNFDGNKTVLTRRYPAEDVSARTGQDVEEIKLLIEKYRLAMREARDTRVPPTLDTKKITSWNALAITALAHGYRYTGENRYKEAASKTVDFLYRIHRRPTGALWRTSTDGEVSGDGIIDDYAFLANALFDLFEATGDAKPLLWAGELADLIQERFRHEEAGYYQTSDRTHAPLGRQVEITDSVEPSGISMALRLMLRISAIREKPELRQMVRSDIEAYAQVIKQAGMEMAGWLDVGLLLAGPFYELVVAVPDNAPEESLLAMVDRLLPPYMITIEAAGDFPDADLMRAAPAVDDKPPLDGAPTAYLCQFGSCNAPTTDPDVLLSQMREDWKK